MAADMTDQEVQRTLSAYGYPSNPFYPVKIARALLERSTLNLFKIYTHIRLDNLGIPEDPDPLMTRLTGCRVGSRFNAIDTLIETVRRVAEDLERDASNDYFSDGHREQLKQRAEALRDALLLGNKP